ncbi:muts domain V-domain-containing protein [Paraphysoderma sedebokerense]|nr:muts domain V-domain-containing protein [Paraphysoderma sedebokerense]
MTHSPSLNPPHTNPESNDDFRRRVRFNDNVDLFSPFRSSTTQSQQKYADSLDSDGENVDGLVDPLTGDASPANHAPPLVDEYVERIIMAMSYKNRSLGCAYYNVANGKLFLMDDIAEADNFEALGALKYQINPSVIIASSKSDEKFLNAIQMQDGDANPDLQIEIRPAIEFSYTASKHRLIHAQMGITQKSYVESVDSLEANQQEALWQLSSIFKFESFETVACAGALLTYLNRSSVLMGELPDDEESGLTVREIKKFTLERYLQLNSDALQSLSIFDDYTKGKKQLSLFGLLNRTKTFHGSQTLRMWFMRPPNDIDIIQERHNTIALFLRPENANLAEQMCTALRGVKNVRKIGQLLTEKMKISDWQGLLKFAYNAMKILNLSRDINGPASIMSKIREKFDVEILRNVGTFINDVIDFDESINENRMVVKPNIDPPLDDLKRTYAGLDSFLSTVAESLSTTIPSRYATSLNVIYFPQLGFLVTTPLTDDMIERNEYDIPETDLEYQFCTGVNGYYKNGRMRELDEHIGDIHGLIVDKEIEIMQQLQEAMLNYLDTLLSIYEVCVELDCLLALTESAKLYGYARPVMTSDNTLEIVNGRHPLQEHYVQTFISNDTYISCEKNKKRIMILSGANYSGKSVYLKQVALIVYLAHVGSYVPAEYAKIGITDKILTRIQTRETVSKAQSAFMIDLQQVHLALATATERSLVLLDEFGKGTVATDGIGLFCGVIDHFAQRENPPKVIATTHFHEIFNNNLLNPKYPIAYYSMQILQHESELTFLYKIVEGRSLMSFGTFCAMVAGVPPKVVERAVVASERFSRFEPINLTTESDEEKTQKKVCKNLAEKFMELKFETVDDVQELFDYIKTMEEYI